ncbi:hypothetical protein V5799_019810 [Amblyomma americanum]|uniref:Endonuclease/exonuclease/phosphatase domain-containing protein n=1 Tax=Amblyomma americanum TaxID=6943 RepID=A0AAQ4EVV3_AMBAM
MAAPATAITTAVKGPVTWHWNCNGFASKKAVLQQHITQVARKPDIIMIQETRTDAVSLPGYRVYAKSPKVSGGRGICTLVRKGLTFIEHEVHSSKIEYTLIDVITGKKEKNITFLLNVYSSPLHLRQKFQTLLHIASTVARCLRGHQRGAPGMGI